MPTTVKDVLKASGFTEEQIAAMDSKTITSFEGVLSISEKNLAEAAAEKKAADERVLKAQQDLDAAKKAQDAAEIAQRSNVEFYETKITPALSGWETEKKELIAKSGNAEAALEFYKKQIETAKTAGYLPTETPAFVLPNPSNNPSGNGNQQRDDQGRFVPNANTPGSPAFVPEQLVARAGDAWSMMNDLQWEYQRLHGGQPMPMLPSQLIAEADKFKLSPRDFAERHFDFAKRRQEMADKVRAEEAQKIATEAVKPVQEKYEADMKTEREKWAAEKKDLIERSMGSNPDVRFGQSSQFSDIKRAVVEKTRPDPLSMNDNERRAATRSAIYKEVAETAVQ